MTLQDIFLLIAEHKSAVLLTIFFAPWLAIGLCVVIPGRREEPFILSFNLAMACLSLLMAVGYLAYATHYGGWDRVVQEADVLLMLAPCYYVGVSLWVAKQRLPLQQLRAVRVMQGLALIGVGYLGVAWFLSKIRFLIFSYLPFPLLLLLGLGLLGIMYLGYLRLTGKDAHLSDRPGNPPANAGASGPAPTGIDDELEALRREITDQND